MPILRKLGAFAPLSPGETAPFSALLSERVAMVRGTEIASEGQVGRKIFFVRSGWGASAKLLRDGRRQIISLVIPGDCVGLRCAALERWDHSFTALTDIEVSSFDTANLRPIFNAHPNLRRAILRAASHEESVMVHRLVGIGRLNALSRTAQLFTELHARLQLVGLGTDRDFDCPLNQNVLADTLGLSHVHVNRVLRQLRERKLLTFNAGNVRILNAAELRALAGIEVTSGG